MVLQIDHHTMAMYSQYKAQLHFTQSSDTQFIQFLLNTTVHVSDLLKHLAPTFKDSADVMKEKPVTVKEKVVTVKEEMIEQAVVEGVTDITPQLDKAMKDVSELKRKLSLGDYSRPQKRPQPVQREAVSTTQQIPSNTTLTMLETELESVLASLSSHETVSLTPHDARATVSLTSHNAPTVLLSSHEKPIATDLDQCLNMVNSITSLPLESAMKSIPVHGTSYNTKGSYKRYTDKTLHKAVHMVQAGEMTQSQASKLFDIPRQTLQYRIYKYKKRDEELKGGHSSLSGKMMNVVKKSANDSNRCLQQGSNLHVLHQHNHIRTVLENLYNKNSITTLNEQDSITTLNPENSIPQSNSSISTNCQSHTTHSTVSESPTREPYTLSVQNVENIVDNIAEMVNNHILDSGIL